MLLKIVILILSAMLSLKTIFYILSSLIFFFQKNDERCNHGEQYSKNWKPGTFNDKKKRIFSWIKMCQPYYFNYKHKNELFFLFVWNCTEELIRGLSVITHILSLV